MDKEDRYSLPFFYNPTYNTNILNTTSSMRLYKEINWAICRKRADGDFANLGKEVQISDYFNSLSDVVSVSHCATDIF